MSMEAMKTLAEAEATAAARIKDCEGSCEATLSEANRAGDAMKAEHRTAAEGEAKAMLAAAEGRAAEATQIILAEATAACDALEQQAKSRLAEAAALIAERVVNI